MRIPKSAEEKRATKAARQARWRANAAKREALQQHIDYSAGAGPKPTRPMPKISGADLTTAYRDRMKALIDQMDDEQLLDKDVQAAIANALKAQNALDAREKAKAKTGQTLELLAGLRLILLGGVPAPEPLQLDDGQVIEGEAVEVAAE
jgi:hypothetical protein